MKCPNCAAVILIERPNECPECGVRLETETSDTGESVLRWLPESPIISEDGYSYVTQEGGVDGVLWGNAIHRGIWPTPDA